MTLFFFLTLFIAFAAAGLHFSVLGSVWPIVYEDFRVALSAIGYINVIVATGRIISSFYTDKLVRRFGTFKVAIFGFSIFTLSIFGYANSRSFLMLCLSSIPLGFGEDFFVVAINSFSAIHLKSKHINWLNMVWSLGATAGPYIMSFFLRRDASWNVGFLALAIIQFAILLLFLSSRKQWKKIPEKPVVREEKKKGTSKKTYKLKNMPIMLIAFFSYAAIETTAALWGSSYIIIKKGFAENVGTLGTTYLFLGMTAGRLISGFISDKIGNKEMMHIGQIMIVVSGLTLAFLQSKEATLISMVIMGLGCAPIFPSFIHYIPQVFGAEYTGSIIGLLMGSSQIATILMPISFGWVADLGGMWLYPFFQMFFALLMMSMLIYQHQRN